MCLTFENGSRDWLERLRRNKTYEMSDSRIGSSRESVIMAAELVARFVRFSVVGRRRARSGDSLAGRSLHSQTRAQENHE